MWLLIALLPLHEVAHGWTTAAAANPHRIAMADGDRLLAAGPAADVAPAAIGSTAAKHPYHGGMVAAGLGTSSVLGDSAIGALLEAGSSDGDTQSLVGLACSLSALCHASLAPMARPMLLPDTQPGDRPAALQTGRMPQGTAAGIDRPPRTQG